MKYLFSLILLSLILNTAVAQNPKSLTGQIPALENDYKGTWLKISYALGDCPLKKNDMLFLKGNTIKYYVGKALKHTYELDPFKISYQYPMQCIKAPCPMGEAEVTVYYNKSLNGSLKVKAGQFYFIDLYAINEAEKVIKEGSAKWSIKATVIKKPMGIKY
ncbi:MAG: hypothetical protein ABI091_15490 [Ferruginibacter sp.]